MANPSKITYVLPTTNTDGTALAAGDIDGIEIGVRLATGTAGAYPFVVVDKTFSEEPISSFGLLAPGNYKAAARTKAKSGQVSAWTGEVSFTIEPSIPLPPSALSVV